MFANIAIPVPLHQLFTYAVPDGMGVSPGMRVHVPFHHRRTIGYVFDLVKDSPPHGEVNPHTFTGVPPLPIHRCGGVASPVSRPWHSGVGVKEILGPIDSAFDPSMLRLIKWISEYYCAPIGEVCRAALPGGIGPKKPRKEYDIDDVFKSAPQVKLTDAQASAYEAIHGVVLQPKFQTFLLHGVTGSGKTEVYLRLLEDVVKTGRGAIFLVPEIALTSQTVGRIMARFGDITGLTHSSLGTARRTATWRAAADGTIRIIVGTRSGVFAPFRNLGLIIIDEEHDSSYKQEESPRYNARDVAVMRAQICGVPIVLGSATPSIESYYNSTLGKYRILRLPERPGLGLEIRSRDTIDDGRSLASLARTIDDSSFVPRPSSLVHRPSSLVPRPPCLPSIEIIDMRGQKGWLSPLLRSKISEKLERNEQVILFINRRGFANFILCRDCGETVDCPNCSITLTYHKLASRLICHYCDYNIPIPDTCGSCKGIDFKPLGLGTERLEAELREIFNNARIARLDRDTVRAGGRRQEILSKMKKGEVDILVGTQMVTKGHDFPDVTLVGVVDADVALHLPDFRAGERTYQLLTQVAGRAGRGTKPGEVIIQTYNPAHYSILAARKHDYVNFYEEEINYRKGVGYPPFGRLALIRIQGIKKDKVMEFADQLAEHLHRPLPERRVTILGPAPAPLEKVRGKFRWQILLKSSNIKALAQLSKAALSLPPPTGVRMAVDVDPVNMM